MVWVFFVLILFWGTLGALYLEKLRGRCFVGEFLLEPVWCVESYQNQTGVLKWEAIRSSENWKKMDGKYSVKWFKSFSIGSMGPVCLPTYIILSDQSNIGKYTNPMDRPWVLDRFSIFQQILVNSTTQFSKERVLPKNTGLKTMKVNLLVPTNKIMMMNILWSRGTAGPKMHQGFFWTCWKSPVYHVFLAHHTLICGALVGVLCFYKWNSGLLSKSYDNPSCCIQGNDPIWTNIFRRGWNHHLEKKSWPLKNPFQGTTSGSALHGSFS